LGAVTGWCGTNLDIDDRRRAEDAVRASQHELSLVIDNIPGFVWCASTDGQLTYVNKRLSEYVGAPVDSLLDNGWLDAVHPDDRKAALDTWMRCIATGAPLENQYRLRRADGVYRWFHVPGQLGPNSDGQPTLWYGLLVDIEERKRAEQALGVQNTRLQLLLDLTNRITSNLELHQLLQASAGSIRELMNCDYVDFALSTGDRSKLQIYALDFPNGKGLLTEELVVSSNPTKTFPGLKPVLYNEIKSGDHSPEMYERFVREGLKSLVLIPLVSQGRLVGNFGLGRRGEDRFTEEDAEFLMQARGADRDRDRKGVGLS
jgi:PAS domain S-box-containing protein